MRRALLPGAPGVASACGCVPASLATSGAAHPPLKVPRPPRSDCAWGEDELAPLACSGAHWLNLSLTLVDSLDTLYLLGLSSEFEEAAR